MKVFHNTKIGNSEATVLVEEMVWYYTYVYNNTYLYIDIHTIVRVYIYICIYEYTHIYIIQEAEAWIKVKWQKQNKSLRSARDFVEFIALRRELTLFQFRKQDEHVHRVGIWFRSENVESNIFQYISNTFLRLEMPSQNQASDFWRKFAPILFKPAPWVRDHVQGWSWWSDLQLR